jgi:hypothetical protein
MQHGNRGRSRPWALSPPQQQLILRLAHGKYQRLQRFSLNGKIRTQENLAVSRETVRRIFAIGSVLEALAYERRATSRYV